jgi:glyoxylase-like metal-dependent hydrolase (beta-lactamase superfamily II)
MIDPQPDFQPPVGVAETVAPGVRRLLAPNPSPMTYRGTNTYLVGTNDIAVIDPGPDDPAHLDAILRACASGRISTILVTHAHLDHSPLAAALRSATGAPVLAFSDALGGRSVVMQQLAKSGLMGGGEGVDRSFVPDRALSDGEVVAGPDWKITALHTPGHFGNHMAFALGDQLFSGDLVMGWASSLVSPPDGDLTDFMSSCRRLQSQRWSRFFPGHGAPVDDPAKRLNWLITHRLSRETALIAALKDGPATSARLAEQIYTDTPISLMPAATRNVLAHMIDLYGKNEVEPIGDLSADAQFQLR